MVKECGTVLSGVVVLSGFTYLLLLYLSDCIVPSVKFGTPGSTFIKSPDTQSPAEENAMEEYIQEALAQGYICHSMSPAAADFVFIKKKDGGLRPCINHCPDLNPI
ncbi:hypothetical protein NFI96_009032 [Prochilodus magdalenae]|nr:hypothetical protein NFI96_009032 [Prochilodus magdalenae]